MAKKVKIEMEIFYLKTEIPPVLGLESKCTKCSFHFTLRWVIREPEFRFSGNRDFPIQEMRIENV